MANPRTLNGVASPQSIYQSDTVQNHDIGEPGVLPGGRVYHYSRYVGSATTAAGKLFVAATPLTAFEDLATATTALTLGQQTATGIVATTTIATGNAFQYLCVVDGGGEGQLFRLRSHGTGTGSPTVTAQLFDSPAVASDANTQVSFLKDLYADFVIAVTDSNDRPVGISQIAMVDSSTTATFHWLQSQGPCAAWVEGTPEIGLPLVNDNTTAGNLTSVDQLISVTDPKTPTATSMLTDTVDGGRVIAYQLGVDGTNNEVQMVDLAIRGL